MAQLNSSSFFAAIFFALLPSAALAEQPVDFCPDRPGKDTPPCIVDKGHVMIETSAINYSRERDGSQYEIGETLMRYGLTDRVELQLGLIPFAIAHLKTESGVDKTLRGAGDLTGAAKVNLLNPSGNDTSVAVQAFVTAPTGKRGIGDGEWQGGVLVPISLELTDSTGLALTPEVDILANEEGGGHHVALTGVASLNREIADGLEGSVEIWSRVHREPENKRTEASLDLALAWQPDEQKPVQFDVEVDLGLNHDTPTAEMSAGIAVRF